mmetsp:Transcript_77853/g.137892  ORF Transcript_77853/g.137892 Transcript_77853/m.137892 type:complete len:209 (+) Transcript_77853:508-1134(+)
MPWHVQHWLPRLDCGSVNGIIFHNSINDIFAGQRSCLSHAAFHVPICNKPHHLTSHDAVVVLERSWVQSRLFILQELGLHEGVRQLLVGGGVELNGSFAHSELLATGPRDLRVRVHHLQDVDHVHLQFLARLVLVCKAVQALPELEHVLTDRVFLLVRRRNCWHANGVRQNTDGLQIAKMVKLLMNAQIERISSEIIKFVYIDAGPPI